MPIYQCAFAGARGLPSTGLFFHFYPLKDYNTVLSIANQALSARPQEYPMHTPPFLRPARFFILIALAASAVAIQAEETSPFPGRAVVMAQAVDGATPGTSPSAEAAPGTPSTKEAVPDVLPGLNKKRVAFWGVTFMVISSLVFTVFGAWAIWKTPKPGQQRPDSYEKKRLS